MRARPLQVAVGMLLGVGTGVREARADDGLEFVDSSGAPQGLQLDAATCGEEPRGWFTAVDRRGDGRGRDGVWVGAREGELTYAILEDGGTAGKCQRLGSLSGLESLRVAL